MFRSLSLTFPFPDGQINEQIVWVLTFHILTTEHIVWNNYYFEWNIFHVYNCINCIKKYRNIHFKVLKLKCFLFFTYDDNFVKRNINFVKASTNFEHQIKGRRSDYNTLSSKAIFHIWHTAYTNCNISKTNI